MRYAIAWPPQGGCGLQLRVKFEERKQRKRPNDSPRHHKTENLIKKGMLSAILPLIFRQLVSQEP